jgi:hypothetical protein
VEGLVRHNAATWAAQQVSILRHMTDDAWDLLLSRLHALLAKRVLDRDGKCIHARCLPALFFAGFSV